MDPYLFTIDTAREFRLRRHIREVLLLYVRAHLTSDHVAFTENVVEELLLQTLDYVPMADATSFLLTTDPLDDFVHSLHSLDVAPPEETWTTPSEHARYFRTVFPPPPQSQDLPTEKCWLEDDHYAKLSLICRPMSPPILSRRAWRNTPKIGGTHSRASIPRTKSALIAFLDPNPVPVHSMDDLPAPPVDDILDLRIKLDAATAARLRPFLQSVSVPLMRGNSMDCIANTPNVPEFLNHGSPPRHLFVLDSPPLFSRVTQRRSTHGRIRHDAKNDSSNPTHTSSLVSMLQVVSPELIDGEDGDINAHHMEVVSGWTTSRFSSPPAPSLHSSDVSEVDELWNISPLGTPATSLVAAKMDEVEIPRVRKFGHKNTLIYESANNNGVATLLTNSPGFFITSFISASTPMVLTPKPTTTSQLEGVNLAMHSPHPHLPAKSTSNSLLEQLPSPAEVQSNEETSAGPNRPDDFFEEQQFNDALASICNSTPQDPLSYILDEKLDDKDVMLMDVPNLQPPTTHPRNPTLFPQGMQSFIMPKGEPARLDTTNHGINADGPTAFLRPVKGIKPLALDLSWRPFNFGKTIPTNEEVAEVTKPIQSEDEASGYRSKYEETTGVFFDLDAAPMSAEETQPILTPMHPRGCEEFGTSPALNQTWESGHFEYLLTQRERMRVSGIKCYPDREVEIQVDVDAGQGIAPWSCNDEHGDILGQREDMCHQEELQGSRDQPYPLEYHLRSQTDPGYLFDDSGIDIVDNDIGQFAASDFGVPFLLLPQLQDNLLDVVDTPVANENADDQNENKENVPPGDDRHLAEDQLDPLSTQYDWRSYIEFPESQTPSFEPLSFASQSQVLIPPNDPTNSKAQDVPPLTPSAHRITHPDDHVSTNEYDETNSRATKRRKLNDLVLASSKDLFSAFIGLRNQTTSSRTLEHSKNRTDSSTSHQTLVVPEQILPRGAPDDVFDQHTVRLPEPWIPAAVVHRYLASVTLIQKRALVRELQGHFCQIDLVERYDLDGADIIVDPDSGVLFLPLLALPAHLEPTVERISRESWRYSNLFVVFEAFPSAQSFRIDRSRDDRQTPYPYTPPICKAINKLRRNLGIAEGCGTMDPRCTVTWAFANDIEEAAKFVRCFGEEACVISKERGNGALWGEREWLGEEGREGESDLARVHGMNVFAAFVMLYDRSLDAILESSPEARMADFGQLLGEERMRTFNTVIESRIQQIAPDIAELVIDPGC